MYDETQTQEYSMTMFSEQGEAARMLYTIRALLITSLVWYADYLVEQ